MYSASRTSLEPESSSDRSVESGIGCLLATEGVVSVDGAAGNLSNFGVDLEKQQVHGQITKNVCPRQALRESYRTCVGSRGRRYSTSGNVRANVSRSVVFVLTDTGGEPKENQTLAGRYAPCLRLEAEVIDVERVIPAGARNVQCRQISHEVAHGDSRNEQRFLEDSNTCAVAELE